MQQSLLLKYRRRTEQEISEASFEKHVVELVHHVTAARRRLLLQVRGPTVSCCCAQRWCFARSRMRPRGANLRMKGSERRQAAAASAAAVRQVELQLSCLLLVNPPDDVLNLNLPQNELLSFVIVLQVSEPYHASYLHVVMFFRNVYMYMYVYMYMCVFVAAACVHLPVGHTVCVLYLFRPLIGGLLTSCRFFLVLVGFSVKKNLPLY